MVSNSTVFQTRNSTNFLISMVFVELQTFFFDNLEKISVSFLNSKNIFKISSLHLRFSKKGGLLISYVINQGGVIFDK